MGPERLDLDDRGDDESLFFSFTSIEVATDHFSEENKLGQGGFGPVYKGKLVNGLEIAVKRLNRMSGHGIQQFKNEVKVISKLQHRNLVRLLGSCIEKEERLLVYEYLPNNSLDSVLFDAAKRNILDWKRRKKIIEGVAQGLLYLHKYSRLKIIHRDLKTSNVLLDADLNPKISDFGTARIFGENEMRGSTLNIVGTYGYMSPEYAMDGIYSEKSDVFSFGVMILEIITGKKNTSFYDSDRHLNLIGHVWDLWTEGRISEITDSCLDETISTSEALKYVHVGLLCVQEKAADRPTMSDVVSMLLKESMALATPKRPAFAEIMTLNNTKLPQNPESCSLNEVTISDVQVFSFIHLVIFWPSGAQNSKQDYLDVHNAARAQVGVGPIAWDDTVAGYAHDVANYTKKDCNLRRSGGPYGENLAEGSGDLTARDAVNLWLTEKQFYDYNSNTCAQGQACSHYTQAAASGPSRAPAPGSPPLPAGPPSGRKKSKNLRVKLSVVGAAVATVLAALAVLFWCCKLRNRKGNLRKFMGPERPDLDDKGDDESLFFSFTSIEVATDYFSDENKLGQGGFGPVFKGKLVNGLEVAVKRLNRMSGHGIEQFKNEVKVISKLQHRNLVRLLGSCIEKEERLLVYEYLPNNSLDSVLFDAAKRNILDWKGRLKIIEGVGQGLLYLHKYSRLKIIHRDLKTSNVLLDADLNPKISDFGTARIFGENEMRGSTMNIVGTYGYVSPEYAMDGVYSEKSDVFSFGVMILEIISGKKNTSFYDADRHLNLIGHVWDLWTEGRISEITDSCLDETVSTREALKYVHVGLLCVQEKAADRPTMSDVISMLLKESMALATPKRPAFAEIMTLNNTKLPENPEFCSLNEVTISDVQGR
nr:cysteine-rich receptor-like protein kinase 5 [Coffea arabica]